MRLTTNQITGNGTYSVPTLTGARYVLSVSGAFGGGSLAVKWAAPDGSLTAYSSSPATTGTSWSFTAASEELAFVLTGATSPTLTVSVAPESQSAWPTLGTAAAANRLGTGNLLAPSQIQPFTRIAAIGDSITDAAGTRYVWNQHYLSSACALALGQLQIVSNPATDRPTFAMSGAGTQKIQRNYQDKVAQSAAQAVIIFAGTNDYQLSRTAAQVAATLGEMADAMIAAGKTPIVCEVLPIPSTDPTTAKRAWVAGVNAAITSMMSTRPLAIFCDWAHVLDSSGDGLADNDGDFADYVHPDFEGHRKIGPYLYSKISAYISPTDYFQGIQYVSPNPEMSGTLGVGQIATGWQSYVDPAKTVVKTLIARGGTLGNWQQLAITGTAGAYGPDFNYGFGTSAGYDAGVGQWGVGDEVELFFEFETDDNLSALFDVSPKLQTNISGTMAQRLAAWASGGGTFTAFPRMASGVIVSARYTIEAGTTQIWPNLYISGTGTIRIGRFGIRRAY